jgi:hypothetical protein
MRYLLALLLLTACAPDKPVEKAEKPDDGCVAYLIRPNGNKDCMRR